MWNWISCYLSGRHDYQVTCEPGNIYLRCHHCGKRSMGWELRPEAPVEARVPISSRRPRPITTHAHAGR